MTETVILRVGQVSGGKCLGEGAILHSGGARPPTDVLVRQPTDRDEVSEPASRARDAPLGRSFSVYRFVCNVSTAISAVIIVISCSSSSSIFLNTGLTAAAAYTRAPFLLPPSHFLCLCQKFAMLK